jgi:hypothetical protein
VRHVRWSFDPFAGFGFVALVLTWVIPLEPWLHGLLIWVAVALLLLAFGRRFIRPVLHRRLLKERRGHAGMEFHPDLFEIRSKILQTLAENGFVWLSDFGAVDLQHDVFGLEVTAIRSQELANGIESVLTRMLPRWHHRRTFYEDHNVGELGWKVMISHYPEDFSDEGWKS